MDQIISSGGSYVGLPQQANVVRSIYYNNSDDFDLVIGQIEWFWGFAIIDTGKLGGTSQSFN